FQEVQDFLSLFAGRLSFVFHPSLQRLRGNTNRISYFGKVLNNNVSVISQSGELFFSRLHDLMIAEFSAASPHNLKRFHWHPASTGQYYNNRGTGVMNMHFILAGVAAAALLVLS